MVSKKSPQIQERIDAQETVRVKIDKTQNKSPTKLKICTLPDMILQTIKKTYPISHDQRFNSTNDKARIQQEYLNQVKDEIVPRNKIFIQENFQKQEDFRANITEVHPKSVMDELKTNKTLQFKGQKNLQFQVYANPSGSELYSSVKKQINSSSDKILTKEIYIESDSNRKFFKKPPQQNNIEKKINKMLSIIQKLKPRKKSKKHQSINAQLEQAELEAIVNEQSLKHLQNLNFDSVLKAKNVKNKIAFLSDLQSSEVQSKQLANTAPKRYNPQIIDGDKEIPLIRRLLSIAQLQALNPSESTPKTKKIMMKSFKNTYPAINIHKTMDGQISSSYKETPTAKLKKSINFFRNPRFDKTPEGTGPVYYNQFCDNVRRRKSQSKRKSNDFKKNTKSMKSFAFV